VANPGASGRWVRGNQNVQISQVAGSTINVRIDGGLPRRVPAGTSCRAAGPKCAVSGQLAAGPVRGVAVRRPGRVAVPTDRVDNRPGPVRRVSGRWSRRLREDPARGATQRGSRAAGVVVRVAVPHRRPRPVGGVGGHPDAALVVIDYAESRGEQLEVVLPWLAEQATTEWPVRVLLLVRAAPRRSDDWTEPLRGRGDWLDAVLDDVQVRVLDDSPPTLGNGPRCSARRPSRSLPGPTRARRRAPWPFPRRRRCWPARRLPVRCWWRSRHTWRCTTRTGR